MASAGTQPAGIISGTGVVTGIGTPTRSPGGGGTAGALGSGAGAAGGGGGVYGLIDWVSAVAAAVSMGSFAVPSQTTNHRSPGWLRCAPAVPTTPAQIWPLGLLVSVNFTS